MTSPSTPEAALESLQATALTARCHNAFFRQKQLKTLHDTLRNNINEIRDAIKQDTYISDEEATTEVAIVLDLVREHYGSIDATKELEAEYKITNGKNAGDRRIPWGVIYIEPQKSHTPFFSALSPLSAAIAAGACVALKLENNLRTLPSLLRKLLTEALESDTFAVISSDPSSESLSACLQVFQEKQISPPTYSQHVSPRAKVVAIVDRTADLASAAEQLVTARFAFGGTSPYAPDIVLVNEFVKKEFLEHVLKHSFRFLAGSSSVSNGSTSNGKERPSRISSTFNALSESKSWKVNVITQGDNGAILDLTNLASLPPKAEQPVFCVSAITSLEHAISLVEDDLEPQESLLAGYHFGTPSTDKYLSQFVIANASFGNHIPFRLLLGPAAPLSQPFDVEKRYTVQQFTRASPAYITAPASQASMVKLLSGKDAGKAANELLHKATQEIKEKKRAESIAIGYFEQGILIGLGVYGIPLLTCIGATLFFGVRAGLRKMAFI